MTSQAVFYAPTPRLALTLGCCGRPMRTLANVVLILRRDPRLHQLIGLSQPRNGYPTLTRCPPWAKGGSYPRMLDRDGYLRLRLWIEQHHDLPAREKLISDAVELVCRDVWRRAA